jgi:amino acid transporter
MLTGLGIACLIYVLVVVAVIAVLPLDYDDSGDEGILLHVVEIGAPSIPIKEIFPYLTVFAVANTALINMLMASRLIYGMSRQRVLPQALGKVLPNRRSPWTAIIFTTVLAFALIIVVNQLSGNSVVTALAGTTGLLLLCVFAVVNVACLILKRGEDKTFFRAPVWIPVLGAILCLFLAGPWARTDKQMIQYKIAGVMLLLGVVLWGITYVVNRIEDRGTGFEDAEKLEEETPAK